MAVQRQRDCGRLGLRHLSLLVATLLASVVVVITVLLAPTISHTLRTSFPHLQPYHYPDTANAPPLVVVSPWSGNEHSSNNSSSPCHVRRAAHQLATRLTNGFSSNHTHTPAARTVERRVACSLWFGHQGANEPVFSRCVQLPDTSEAAARRRAGELLDVPMQANTGDPLTGGYFHTRLEMDELGGPGGRLTVVHENCRPEQLNQTAPDSQQALRDHIRHEWGPTMLQLYVVGPELHTAFLRPVVAAGLHPCTYHVRYVVHTAGEYQLHVQWLHTDYHHFLHRQPLWARAQYGLLLGPVSHNITRAEPIAIPRPVDARDVNGTLRSLHYVGNFTLLPLPEWFTRCVPQPQPAAAGGVGLLDDGFRMPQGLGRWVRTGTLTTGWWPRPSYAQQLTAQYTDSAQYKDSPLYNRTITDVRTFLRNYSDCYYTDIEHYSYQYYVHSLVQQGALSAQAQQTYQRAAVTALDYHPSVVPQTADTFNRCFAGLVVAFIGDSHSRHMFNAFIERALSVDEYRAIKDPRRKARMFGPQDANLTLASTAAATAAPTGSGRPGRRLTGFVWGKGDDEIAPWTRADPLPLFSSWQCISKGANLESVMGQEHGHVVADACVWEKGWPEADKPIVHQGILESDVLFYNFGHWQAANDPTHFPIMDLDHLSRYMDGFFRHWNATLLTPAMHQRQIDRWLATHTHLAAQLASNVTFNPFIHRRDERTGRLERIPLGGLSLLDVFREKAVWWVSQVYTSHFEKHFFHGSDGRTPARLELYAEVQRAVATRWRIRQYSDTRHVALPYRNCVTPDDFGHVAQPVYEAQLAGLVDKVAQMRQCSSSAEKDHTDHTEREMSEEGSGGVRRGGRGEDGGDGGWGAAAEAALATVTTQAL